MTSSVKTPLPVPKFYSSVAPTFSTKKEKARRTSPRISSSRPPVRPGPAKSAPPPLSRIRPRRWIDQRAHLISFKAHSDSYLDLLTPRDQVNDTRPGSYFSQHFEKICKIGEGSFGEVFKVKWKENGKLYAVKRAVDRFRSSSDRAEKLREVQKHEELPKHPNLVEFISAWEEKGRLYIQTELCSTSLANYSEMHHNLPEALIWKYLVDLLLAVKHLHNHNLVHMDIKPENIFISQDGFCKLGDFGLVFDLSRPFTDDPQEGDAKYLAPELLRNQFGKEADIFSLGISFLEISCDLDLPNQGEAWQMLRQGLLPTELMTHLSDDLICVIAQMMHPDPRRRPSASDLLKLSRLRGVYFQRRSSAFILNSVTFSKTCILSLWFILVFLFSLLFLPATKTIEWYKQWSGGKRKFSAIISPYFAQPSGLGRTPNTEDRLAMPLRYDNSSSDEDDDMEVADNRMDSSFVNYSRSPTACLSNRSTDSPMNLDADLVAEDTSSSSSGPDEHDKNRNFTGGPWNSTPAQTYYTKSRCNVQNGISNSHTGRVKVDQSIMSLSPVSEFGDCFRSGGTPLNNVSRTKMQLSAAGDTPFTSRASPKNLKMVFDYHGSSSDEEFA